MDLILAGKAIIMGIVEGLTEFLPISSTGHLILTGELLKFNDESGKVFEIVIQFGAILAVCWEYRAKIMAVVKGLFKDAKANHFALNIIIATLPAGVLGFAFGKLIKQYLFNSTVVALAFIVGGVIILWVERRQARSSALTNPRANVLLENAKIATPRVETVDDLSYLDAFKVGMAQCLAMIPGTSRSGATIIGGLLFGLSRKAATEFSFFLAIPVIFGVTVVELVKSRHLLNETMVSTLSIGFIAATISAFFCVRWLLKFIATHDFKSFAWYRIGFGILVLLSSHFHWINWSN